MVDNLQFCVFVCNHLEPERRTGSNVASYSSLIYYTEEGKHSFADFFFCCFTPNVMFSGFNGDLLLQTATDSSPS